jgi:lactate dehydrogenase-like 2-hydroxyacid dehydrogenase
MTRILQVGPLMPSLAETLASQHHASILPDGADRDSFLAEHASSVEIAVTSGRIGVGTELMEALPTLQAVINFGVGYDTTDVKMARARDVLVSNTPDVLTDCVADLAIGLTIDVMRGISAADRYVRRGAWPVEGNWPFMHRMSGKRVGILGLGRIGSAIATRFEAFGCPIAYHQRTELSDGVYRYCSSAKELAEWSNILVIAASGGASTHGLVDHDVLAALGGDGYLINIARGSVVDEDALVSMLTSGAIAGAGLDVFADEPKVPEALFGLDNVVVLPHIGSGTHETRAAMSQLVLDNLDQFLRDGTLLTPVPEVMR